MKLHTFEANGKGVRCTVCLQTWRTYPYSQQCPQIPVHRCERRDLPTNAVTKWELDKMGLGDLIPQLPAPIGIWDNGDKWKQIFDITALGLKITLEYKNHFITAREMRYLGIEPKAEYFTHICKHVDNWQNREIWTALCHPPIPMYTEQMPRGPEMLTLDELYEAGYSTAKTKLPDPCAILRINQSRVEWLYITEFCQYRRMNKKQRNALILAQAYSRRTDDIEAALYFAYGKQTAAITVTIRSPKMRGWICEALIIFYGEHGMNTGKIQLGENRKEVFSKIREIAAAKGNTIPWHRVSGDWELQKDTYLGDDHATA